ncbi:uncharacterized protein LOC131891295 [Tigriopus californicus]|uniref:uncharacterized protein LOC131891295 n=1 Tax=Tigriopus californicus TaxID=6832 RepID=UPI0027D9F8BC|nr:uncharacterized protein LOC131891295 [Tigriopus californicus]
MNAEIQVGPIRCKIRVGLDSFAAHSYVRKNIVEQVGIPVLESIPMEVHGLGGTVSKGKADVVQFDLVSNDGANSSIKVNAVVKADKICSPLPPIDLGSEELACLYKYDLPSESPGSEVIADVLLGADYCWRVQKPRGGIFVLEVHAGHYPGAEIWFNGTLNPGLDALDHMMEKFWTLESVGIMDKGLVHTEEDQLALDLFEKSLKRCDDGHYEVGLPFKKDRVRLENNYIQAKRLLESTEKRFDKCPELKIQYCKAMKEYEENGYAREVSRAEIEDLKNEEVFFIPHHGVARTGSVSTALRVVFNASSPDRNGVSLNDLLLPGPPLQNDIVAKIMIQELWILGVSWDEVIEGEIAQAFIKWCEEIPLLSEIKIPRIGSTIEKQGIQLVGFGDASESAYGAVIYAVIANHTRNSRVTFMIAKTRVAPIKFKSIARLELLAAHLLCRLMKYVSDALESRVVTRT